MTSVRAILAALVLAVAVCAAVAVGLALTGCVEVQVPYRLPPPVVEAPPVACPPAPPLPDCACPDGQGIYRDTTWQALLDRAATAADWQLCDDIEALINQIPRRCTP